MSHVLVVDDEPTICWSFRELLRDEGHEVTIASSAEEALTVAGSTPLDAIVLDVRLPGMDGISAMSKLKKASGSAPSHRHDRVRKSRDGRAGCRRRGVRLSDEAV